VAKGSRAWVSHHIGDLEHEATLRAFQEGIEHFERLFAVAPELVAYDLHPGYLSTSYALDHDGVARVGIQHHHAHLAACLAENGLAEPAVGVIFDGTGYGTDGTVWGGELLVGDLRGFERVGSLRAVPMPGGTAAIRQPWRMARSWVAEALDERVAPVPVRLRGAVSGARWDAMSQVASHAELSPMTTSIGRLFDAVGALCGVRAEISYEGQAAVELEALAARTAGDARYALEVAARPEDGLLLDPRSLLRAVLADLDAGVAVEVVAAGFHAAVAEGSAAAAARAASERGLGTVVLSGGVFQNRLLLESMTDRLTRAGLRVLVPQRLPVNDGGISYGQAAIAAARDAG
jgi:hydrogenase maturation protein HypF